MDLAGLASKQLAATQLLQSQPTYSLPVPLLDKILTPSGGSLLQRLGARIVSVNSQSPNQSEAGPF